MADIILVKQDVTNMELKAIKVMTLDICYFFIKRMGFSKLQTIIISHYAFDSTDAHFRSFITSIIFFRV